jgi:hypothetical protein
VQLLQTYQQAAQLTLPQHQKCLTHTTCSTTTHPGKAKAHRVQLLQTAQFRKPCKQLWQHHTCLSHTTRWGKHFCKSTHPAQQLQTAQ